MAKSLAGVLSVSLLILTLAGAARCQGSPPTVSGPFDFGSYTEFFVRLLTDGQSGGTGSSGPGLGVQELNNLRAKAAEGRIGGVRFRAGMMPNESCSDFLERVKQLREDGEDLPIPLAGTRDRGGIIDELLGSGPIDDKTIEIAIHECILGLIRCFAIENLPAGLTPDDIATDPNCIYTPILLGVLRHELDHAENDKKPRTENRAENECRAYQREVEFLCNIKLLDKFNPIPDTSVARIARATIDARVMRACDLAVHYCVESTGESHVFRQIPAELYLSLLVDLVPDFSPKCILLLQE